jgi:hypothetical protein
MSARASDKPLWTLDEGLALLRELEPHLFTLGFNIALGGGLATRGSSNHDVDFFITPANVPKVRQAGAPFDTHDREHYIDLIAWLSLHESLRYVACGWWNKVMRKVEMRDANNRKIDFFIVTAFNA